MQINIKSGTLLDKFLRNSYEYRNGNNYSLNAATVISEMIEFIFKQFIILLALFFVTYSAISVILFAYTQQGFDIPDYIVQIFMFRSESTFDRFLTFFKAVTGVGTLVVLIITTIFNGYAALITMHKRFTKWIGNFITIKVTYPDDKYR
jgi:hypothetical protein